ncbi:hypothetical protein M422DRAFT_49187 [Sphaerobolus stellatus SS14]|uniref:Uncharacterized protein n=1 Tax=Sphaerobolus stellatus (strain SS14) TaxID=990650 RepID=A0A0C9UZC4_SPHS4|nr:hypothetical protein M422DRAFT_49187 [Sphaerobolus stellatus SS14]
MTITWLLFIGNQGLALVALRYGACNTDPAISNTIGSKYFASAFGELIGFLIKGLLTSIGTILFESSVLVVTILYTWNLRGKLSNRRRSKSLAELLLRQGVIRFGIIFIWNFAETILSRVLLDGIDGPLENAISCILVCRFLLELRKYAADASSVLVSTSSLNRHRPTSAFYLAMRRLDRRVRIEFGDQESVSATTTFWCCKGEHELGETRATGPTILVDGYPAVSPGDDSLGGVEIYPYDREFETEVNSDNTLTIHNTNFSLYGPYTPTTPATPTGSTDGLLFNYM